MGFTRVNLLLDVGFNREVAEDGALYWTKEKGNLSQLVNTLDKNYSMQNLLGEKAKKRILESFTWDLIVDLYENEFLKRGH